MIVGACLGLAGMLGPGCGDDEDAVATGGLGGSGGIVTGGGGASGGAEPYVPWVEWQPDPSTMTHALHLGPLATVYEPSDPTEIAGFPRAYGFDVGQGAAARRKIVIGITQNEDDANATQRLSSAVSSDGGETFPSSALTFDAGHPTQTVRLLDGRVLDVGFRPTGATADTLTIDVAHSADDAASFTASSATVQLAQDIAPLGRTHLGLPLMADGTVMVPHYVAFAGDSAHSVVLLSSTDGGQSWQQRGIIVRAQGSTAYNETSVARTSTGDLLAVFRVHEAGVLSPLAYARSADDGLTWSTPQPLQVVFGSDPPAPRIGVDPRLQLMPNGVLVLSSGRPDNWIACSWDGTGDSFEAATITYVNRPAPPGHQDHGSSGYSGMAFTAPNRLVLTGDNCAPSWGCPPGDTGFTVDDRYRVWRRLVDVLTPGVGKIDLWTKLHAGVATVDTNMSYTSADHPRAAPAGAFDGSTEIWSAAVRLGNEPGTYTIALDRQYFLHRIGLALAVGRPARATLRVSDDGVRWSVPIVDTTTSHDAMVYIDLPQAARARHVRLTVDPADCPGDLGGECATLTELELYGDVDSFENDALGAVPRGYEGSDLVHVAWSEQGDSRRALHIDDTSATEHAQVSYRQSASARKNLSFRLLPRALPGGFLFDLLGEDAADAVVSAYHLAIFPDGSIRHWDAGSAAWTAVSDPAVVALGAWSELSIQADTAQAVVSVDGEQVATVVPSSPGSTALIGHAFASAGTAPVGDDLLIDDVRLIDGALVDP